MTMIPMRRQFIHVYPINDLREHVTEGTDCWCKPQWDEEHDILTHDSLDQREKYETSELKEH